jgi:transcription elongation factor SPT5
MPLIRFSISYDNQACQHHHAQLPATFCSRIPIPLSASHLQVRSGPYARYKGRVKQETASHLQLELDAINKIVTVKRGDVLGAPGRGGMPAAAGRGGFMPGRGPMGGFGGFNPAAAAAGGPPRTPAHVMQVRGVRRSFVWARGFVDDIASEADQVEEWCSRQGWFHAPRHDKLNPAAASLLLPFYMLASLQTPMHPSMGGATPLHPSMGGATPLHPSMTPMHPSMTPMHPGMTPAHPSSEPDYYGSGPSSRGGSGYGGSAAAAGGRGPPPPAAATPGGYGGYGGGGAMASTPGLGSYVPAPTPGTAETPGAAFAGARESGGSGVWCIG